jgi:Bacterial PH domain
MSANRIELRATRGAPFVVGLLAALPIAMIAMLPEKMTVLVCGAVACAMVAVAIYLGFRRLVVDEDGVATRGLFGARRIGWDDIVGYRFWSYELKPQGGRAAQAALVIGAIGYLERGGRARGADNRRFGTGAGTGRLTLIGRDGTRIAIDGRYRDVVSVLDRIFAEMHRRLRAEARQSFAPFAFDGSALRFRGNRALELGEIELISVTNDKLAVRKRGARLSWVATSMKRVDNGVLLLEELARRGVAVQASAGVFLPKSPPSQPSQ